MAKIERLQYVASGTDSKELVKSIEAFLRGGGRWVQLRMKEVSFRHYLRVALEVRALTQSYQAVFLVNDNVQVAVEAEADGVHLGKSDTDTLTARRMLPLGAIIGRTANELDDVIALNDQPIDYIGLGPLRFTTTKKNLSPVLGLEGYGTILTQLKERNVSSVPIVAIGSVCLDDLPLLASVGVYGVALSGALLHASDTCEATCCFVKQIKTNFIR